jgi:acyl carrier protein
MSETGNQNLRTYNKIFCETFGIQEEILNDDFTFKKVEEWDSVAHFALISELDDTFDIMLKTEDILHFGSYKNGMLILQKYGVEFP